MYATLVPTWLHFPSQNPPKSRLGDVLKRLGDNQVAIKINWKCVQEKGWDFDGSWTDLGSDLDGSWRRSGSDQEYDRRCPGTVLGT